MATLNCVVVTPERIVLEQTARSIVLPMYDGELGVLPGHSPMLGRLGYGEMRIQDEAGNLHRYYVDGGFVQVTGSKVSVLTPRSMPVADLDAAAAEEQLRSAQSREAIGAEMAAVRDQAVNRARAQLRLARRR